jgi:hypothetical protein
MKHAFSNVTAEGLIAAIKALTDTPRGEDQQIVTIGRHNVTGEWIVNVSDAADGDATTGEGLNHRTFGSPELSHALYSALVDHAEAFDVFKAATGWSK